MNKKLLAALVVTLFLQHLPIVVTAALLPGLALAGRARWGIIAFVTFLLHHGLSKTSAQRSPTHCLNASNTDQLMKRLSGNMQ